MIDIVKNMFKDACENALFVTCTCNNDIYRGLGEVLIIMKMLFP